MTSQWWSWFFTVTGATCVWLMSWKSWRWQLVGWVGATLSQVVWFVYGIVTRQWGFLASALLYGVVDVRMVWVMWYRRKRDSTGGRKRRRVGGRDDGSWLVG